MAVVSAYGGQSCCVACDSPPSVDPKAGKAATQFFHHEHKIHERGLEIILIYNPILTPIFVPFVCFPPEADLPLARHSVRPCGSAGAEKIFSVIIKALKHAERL